MRITPLHQDFVGEVSGVDISVRLSRDQVATADQIPAMAAE
jgi:hypothetical protein